MLSLLYRPAIYFRSCSIDSVESRECAGECAITLQICSRMRHKKTRQKYQLMDSSVATHSGESVIERPTLFSVAQRITSSQHKHPMYHSEHIWDIRRQDNVGIHTLLQTSNTHTHTHTHTDTRTHIHHRVWSVPGSHSLFYGANHLPS